MNGNKNFVNNIIVIFFYEIFIVIKVFNIVVVYFG